MLIVFDCPSGDECAVRADCVMTLEPVHSAPNLIVEGDITLVKTTFGDYCVKGTVKQVAAKLNGMDGAGGQIVPTDGALKPRHRR